MLSREYLREHADAYRIALKNRGANVDLERFLDLDAERRRTIAQVEALKAQRNTATQEIANLKKNNQDNPALITAMKRVGEDIKKLDERLAGIRPTFATSSSISPMFRTNRFPSVRTKRTTVSTAPGATSRRFPSRRKRIGTSAKRWASSTSSAPRRSPELASPSSPVPARSSTVP